MSYAVSGTNQVFNTVHRHRGEPMTTACSSRRCASGLIVWVVVLLVAGCADASKTPAGNPVPPSQLNTGTHASPSESSRLSPVRTVAAQRPPRYLGSLTSPVNFEDVQFA